MSEKQQLVFQNQNEEENKIIEYDNIKYLINEEENTAGIIGCEKNLQQVHIPRSIKQGTKEFNITRIMGNAFESSKIESIRFPSDSKLERIEAYAFSSTNIKSITIPSSVTLIGENAFLDCKQFEIIEIPNDSKLQTIDKKAFSNSTIESIKIPSELVNLKKGWCYGISKLTKIIVSPNNPRYCLYDDNMILGKMNNESNNYENLIFCSRNIKHIKLPNFIKHIISCSFEFCKQLEVIEFPNDSKLETIDKYAFCYTKIKSIKIPSSVKLIGEGVFGGCKQLEVIEIPNDSKLETIDKYAFCNTKIKSIRIPSSVKLIDINVFYFCKQLQIIEINSKEVKSMYKYYFNDHVNAILMIPVDL